MCMRLKGIDADSFRKHLLDKYGVGVIADGPARHPRGVFRGGCRRVGGFVRPMGAAAKDLLERH